MKIEELSSENFEKQLENRQVELMDLLRTKQKEIAIAPKGGLRTSMSNKTVQFYLVKPNKKRHYIRKHNVALVKSLAQKEYNKKLICEMENEINRINVLLYQLKSKGIESVYEKLHLAKKSFVQPVTLTSEEYRKTWLSLNYKSKPINTDSQSFSTSSGFQVRSKSELIIAETLAKKNIPFRYEYPVQLKKISVYPDFYCLNLRTRKEIAWEHFGMMDDAKYANNTIKKLNAYMESGFFPGDKLIFTMETMDNPLSIKIIELIISNYLL